MAHLPTSFADFKHEGHLWITLAKGSYYPDYLQEAIKLYLPYLELFRQLMQTSESSQGLFLQIGSLRDRTARIQLARIFRKYVSPEMPVEMLKVKTKANSIITRFGGGFRPIQEVQKAYLSRPLPDEALSAILWEYRDRGIKGYDQTEQFFSEPGRGQAPPLPSMCLGAASSRVGATLAVALELCFPPYFLLDQKERERIFGWVMCSMIILIQNDQLTLLFTPNRIEYVKTLC